MKTLIICDHATNHIPAEYGQLGVSDADLQRHIAWDIGAADVARGLGDRLGAPVMLGAVSRLLIDLHRGPEHPGLIPETSDGTFIPGNASVSADERKRRIDRWHRPHHAAIDSEIERLRPVFLVSVHSFTPRMGGIDRPWQVGLLYNEDDRFARRAIDWLREHGWTVGDNQPYSGRELNYTMNRHAEARGLPYFNFELRQDLIATGAAGQQWADRLSEMIRQVSKMITFV